MNETSTKPTQTNPSDSRLRACDDSPTDRLGVFCPECSGCVATINRDCPAAHEHVASWRMKGFDIINIPAREKPKRWAHQRECGSKRTIRTSRPG